MLPKLHCSSPDSRQSRTPPQIRSGSLAAPRLETPRFDPLPFSHIISALVEDFQFEEWQEDPSTLDLDYDSVQYVKIRDVVPEWEDELEDSNFSSKDNSEAPFPNLENKLPPCDITTLQRKATPSFLGDANRREDRHPLSDFLFDPASLTESSRKVIRRSDGRLYVIRKVLQTRRAWAELTILQLIKDARAAFSPTLHWAFEQDHYIYLIMEDYPGGTLAEAVKHHGVFGSLEIFFYGCEILIGLQSLHRAGVVHRNVSPDTIIFDRRGHVILSGVEYGAIINRHQKPSGDETVNGNSKYYQAPELLLGWSYNTLVDSWSFGMVMYFMFHGQHAFLTAEGGEEIPTSGDYTSKILSGGLPNKSARFINPIARDLILKCLERNPAIRLDAGDIQNHPYFSNADWEKVFSKATEAPLPRESLVSDSIVPQGLASTGCDSRECFPTHPNKLGQGNRAKCFVQVLPQFLRPPFMMRVNRDECSTPLDRPFAQPIIVAEQHDHSNAAQVRPQADLTDDIRNIPAENRVDYYITETISSTHEKMASFWDSLDGNEELGSPHSEYSVFSDIKVPFSRAWELHKKRSSIYPHRLFNLSGSSIQQKLRRRTKSVAALKHAAYAEPIPNLPVGLNQIGSGIGFTYRTPVVPPAPVRNSMTSDGTAVPKACHGLLHSLGVLGFWTGSKSATVASVSVNSDMKELVGRSLKVEDGSVTTFSQELEPLGDTEDAHTASAVIKVTGLDFQPPKKSAAVLAAFQELASPIGSALTTSTETDGEEILTPDFVRYQLEGSFGAAGEGLKKLEAMDGLDPESTLRLVTPTNSKFRPPSASGEPYPF